ncbi:hypothetical protein SAMD00023353_9900010 [Rosellinia necatrix]|uniref:Uncharacterized protein n=1 Tax=Rosellinia necatrix TaxID=77044 RepID=A0A1S8AB10_ROSNE|nr:hypothetical protein SAMD00023353_9900010 [Rosellinia necatrix]
MPHVIYYRAITVASVFFTQNLAVVDVSASGYPNTLHLAYGRLAIYACHESDFVPRGIGDELCRCAPSPGQLARVYSFFMHLQAPFSSPLPVPQVKEVDLMSLYYNLYA